MNRSLIVVLMLSMLVVACDAGTLSQIDGTGCNLQPLTGAAGQTLHSFDELRSEAGVTSAEVPDSVLAERGAVVKDGVLMGCVEAEVLG